VWGISCPNPINFFKNLVYSNNTEFSREENDMLVSNFRSVGIKEAADFFHTLVRVDKSVFTVYPSASLAPDILNNERAAIFTSAAYSSTKVGDKLQMVFYSKGPQASDYICTVPANLILAIPSNAKNPEVLTLVIQQFSLVSPSYADELEKAIEAAKTTEKKNTAISLYESIKKIKYTTFDQYAAYSATTENLVETLVNGSLTFEQIISYYKDEAQKSLNNASQYRRKNRGKYRKK